MDIVDFCQRWGIQEFGLFGSIIRSDFDDDSDIDVLVIAEVGFNHLQAQAELGALIGRDVDLVQKRLLNNPFSRHEILQTYRVIYPPDVANFTALIERDQQMTDQARNSAALLDMVKAMQAIERFLTGRTFEDLVEDELLRSAVERQLEILGEAAKRVTKKFQSEHNDIDWANIVSLRYIIIHQYDEIDYALLWEIITKEMPQTLEQGRLLIPPLPDCDLTSS